MIGLEQGRGLLLSSCNSLLERYRVGDGSFTEHLQKRGRQEWKAAGAAVWAQQSDRARQSCAGRSGGSA